MGLIAWQQWSCYEFTIKAPSWLCFDIVFMQVKFWVLRIWCSASSSLSTRSWRTTSLRAQWRKPCPSSSTTSSCTCRSPRTRWERTATRVVEFTGWVYEREVFRAWLFALLFVQIKVWTANPQQFVEDEDDDTFSYSVRISAQDLLLVREKHTTLNLNAQQCCMKMRYTECDFLKPKLK